MEEMEVKVGGGGKVVWGEEVKARGEKVEVVGEAEEMEEMGGEAETMEEMEVKVGGGEKVVWGEEVKARGEKVEVVGEAEEMEEMEEMGVKVGGG
ncbi:hypothetical protein V8C86DRAFT_3123854 [Haematococcus lacustris]